MQPEHWRSTVSAGVDCKRQSTHSASGFTPSAANFLLFRLPDSVDSEALWNRMILDHRVVLRNCANYEALTDGHFRAAVRNDSENDRLIEALMQVLASLGMYVADCL